jgi:predicted transcriptional regulator
MNLAVEAKAKECSMRSDTAIFAVRPKYADKIFSGEKTMELRRIRPKRIRTGSVVMIYVSSPRKALLGAFQVGGVIERSPEALWTLVCQKAHVSRREFNSYFHGSSKGVAIVVEKTASVDAPVSLDQLRATIAGFKPPRSFRYVTLEETKIPLIQRIIRACS